MVTFSEIWSFIKGEKQNRQINLGNLHNLRIDDAVAEEVARSKRATPETKAVVEKADIQKHENRIDEAKKKIEEANQIQFGTMPAGTGQRLREAEEDGVTSDTLRGLFKARTKKK